MIPLPQTSKTLSTEILLCFQYFQGVHGINMGPTFDPQTPSRVAPTSHRQKHVTSKRLSRRTAMLQSCVTLCRYVRHHCQLYDSTKSTPTLKTLL